MNRKRHIPEIHARPRYSIPGRQRSGRAACGRSVASKLGTILLKAFQNPLWPAKVQVFQSKPRTPTLQRPNRSTVSSHSTVPHHADVGPRRLRNSAPGRVGAIERIKLLPRAADLVDEGAARPGRGRVGVAPKHKGRAEMRHGRVEMRRGSKSRRGEPKEGTGVHSQWYFM